jgi:hypothetical protein
MARPRPARDAVDQLAHEGDGLLRVVHIAGPVLDPQDVTSLRDVGEQRVVAQVFPVMGIEAAEGPLHLRPGADHGAVDVDRQPRQAARGERFDDDIVIQCHERRERALRELLQPVAHRPRGRDARQAAKARDQRIARKITEVLQAPRADVEEGEHEQGKPRTAIVTRDRRQRATQTGDHRELPEVATEELQPAVRRELLRHEFNAQIILDRSPQRPYLQAHQRGLPESMDGVGTSIHSMRGTAPLVHFEGGFYPSRNFGSGLAGYPGARKHAVHGLVLADAIVQAALH